MIGLGILKILTPKVLKGIMKYVFEENELDIKIQVLENRIKDLAKIIDAQKDFVMCDVCKCKIKEK